MGTRNLYQSIQTGKTPEELRKIAIAAHRFLGGRIQLTSQGFNIIEGTNNIGNSRFANLGASVLIHKVGDQNYEIQTCLNWRASSFTMTFVIILILWPVALFYFGFDPAPHYQYALDQTRIMAEEKTQPRFRY